MSAEREGAAEPRERRHARLPKDSCGCDVGVKVDVNVGVNVFGVVGERERPSLVSGDMPVSQEIPAGEGVHACERAGANAGVHAGVNGRRIERERP